MSDRHPHYTPSPPAKQYESRHRLTWAARFPLKPGADLRTRQAILLQIADTAISGQYYEPQAKLAERVGMSVRGIRKALAKLCAEGALRAQPRGFKRTTRYTLFRLAEVAEHGAFLPPGEASDSPLETNPSSPQTPQPPPLERNPSSSQTPQPPPLERNPSSSQIAFERNPSSYKEDITTRSKEEPPLTPPFILPAPEPGTISPTALRLHEHIVKATGRPLPAEWVFYQKLKHDLDSLNFLEVGSTLAEILERSGGALPEPGEFFKTYQKPKRKPNGNRRRRAAEPHPRRAA